MHFVDVLDHSCNMGRSAPAKSHNPASVCLLKYLQIKISIVIPQTDIVLAQQSDVV